jgi:aminopeptidase N
MGAMENVGCITYNDQYISRGEKFTKVKTENIYNTLLHEISHMWFGNLVTMKWWDDLWLNESFANMISFMCMDEAEGLEDITLAWSNFLDESFWGLRDDQKDTSHSIAANCNSTADAEDIFDGISYGKGASWLRQMIYFYGRETFALGLKNYFAKHSFKNTILSDFVNELAHAAKQLKIVESEKVMVQWTDQWLKTAGCGEISLNF